jgi:hypothetical protein
VGFSAPGLRRLGDEPAPPLPGLDSPSETHRDTGLTSNPSEPVLANRTSSHEVLRPFSAPTTSNRRFVPKDSARVPHRAPPSPAFLRLSRASSSTLRAALFHAAHAPGVRCSPGSSPTEELLQARHLAIPSRRFPSVASTASCVHIVRRALRALRPPEVRAP